MVTRTEDTSASWLCDGTSKAGGVGQNRWGRALGGLIYFAVKLLVRGRRSQDVNNIAEDAVSTSAPGRRSDFSITLSLNKNLSDVFL